MTIDDCLGGWAARSMYGLDAWQAALDLALEHRMENIAETLDRCCREGLNPLAVVEAMADTEDA